jgi:formylglycine-generating enzyme
VVRKLALIGLGLPLLVSLSCSQLVGITDTDVTKGGGGSADPGSGGSGNPGSGKTGVAGSKSNDGGTDNGGAGGSAGTGTMAGAGMSMGGKSTGGTSTGGSSTGGSLAGGGNGGSAGNSGGGGSGGGPAVLHGPKLIDVGVYSIDATEVTVAQYKEFLTAKAGDTSGQTPACSWNTSFYAAAPVPLENNTWPIANVDWCDANAFCAWAGKRLCGTIGGGTVSFANFMDPTKSQWFRACGNGGTHPNDTPECNNDGGFSDVAPVASFPGCEGFDKGVFDMQGNVSEWVDSCDGSTGKADHCISAGGNELNQIAYCTEGYEDITRDFTSGYFGFRCCSM